MAQYFGRAVITADGMTLDTMPGAKLELGGVVRKEKTTDHRTGFVEELKPGRVECEVGFSSETDAEKYRSLVNATVLFSCDTGQKYMVKEAFVEDGVKLEGKDGKMSLKLTGQAAEPM